MECFCHSRVLGLLGGEALGGCVASISQPCLLLKTLSALLLLGLFCDQRPHDDMGSFSLHHGDLVRTVSGRWQGTGRDTGLSFLHLGEVLLLALRNHWLPGDAARVRWRRSHGRRVLQGIMIAECPAVRPDGQGHLA